MHRPLYCVNEIFEIDKELLKEIKRRTGHGGIVQYTLVVDKYGNASVAFERAKSWSDELSATYHPASLRRHKSKLGSSAGPSRFGGGSCPKSSSGRSCPETDWNSGIFIGHGDSF